MTLTREDFLRLLPGAVGHAPWRIEDDLITGEGTRPSWRIRLHERPGRRFGPVQLPVLGVTLQVADATPAERAAFVDRFLLGFQRAGG